MRWVISFLLAVQIAAVPSGFSDVQPGSWYYDAVMKMTAAGWLNGYQDGTFRPEQSITNSEFVSIVARRAGLAQRPALSQHWAAGYLVAALERGWYDYDELPPTGERYDEPIQRQVAVKILMNALLPGVSGDYNTEAPKIRDFSELDGRYYQAVLGAYAAGVAAGGSGGAFRPRDSLSRAEACILIQRAGQRADGALPEPSRQGETPAPVRVPDAVTGGTAEHGQLQVIGTQLCGENGEPVVLRGMSTHGLQWYGAFASEGAVRSLAAYGANLFRVAVYTGEGGYLSRPELKAQVITAIDAAIQNGMYVILDWHILSDGNPMDHLEEAKAFFTEMAQKYRDSPAILYEICNEPNGDVTWGKDVKPYAQQVVQAIRAVDPKGIILIGSSTWSQDLHIAAADPLEGNNLMYTCHFYAGTHGESLRTRIDQALSQGLPVFVSEWGTSRADGSGGVFLKESEVWMDFLAERNISWANWSLCDKEETSAALRPGTDPNGPWCESDLTESGKFVFSQF